MSTLTVTNIQATGETASRAVSGVAAAWVNFDGTGTIAIRGSHNVSSLTDNSGGDYNVNFTNNMGNSNYCTTACCAYASGFAQPSVGHDHTIATKSVSYDNLLVVYASSVTDSTFVEASFHGDLA